MKNSKLCVCKKTGELELTSLPPRNLDSLYLISHAGTSKGFLHKPLSPLFPLGTERINANTKSFFKKINEQHRKYKGTVIGIKDRNGRVIEEENQ